MKEIYMHDSKYAIENGERKLYFDSRHENLRCKMVIEEAIRENFNGSYLAPGCCTPVIEEFGWERVKYELAISVRKQYWDGRFSSTNKKWARKIADELEGTVFVEQDPIASHPLLLNDFITRCRKEMGEYEDNRWCD